MLIKNGQTSDTENNGNKTKNENKRSRNKNRELKNGQHRSRKKSEMNQGARKRYTVPLSNKIPAVLLTHICSVRNKQLSATLFV